MRHILWAFALLATFTLTAAAQREGGQSAAGGGGSSGGSSASSSSGSSGGGYSGGSSSDSGGGYSGGSSSSSSGGSWSGSSSGGSSSRDYSGSSSSSGASTSRGSSGSSSGGAHSSSGSSGGSSAGSSRSDSGSRGSSVAPVLDGGPAVRPPRPSDKHPDKKPQAPAFPAPVAESGNTTVKSAPTWPQREREGGPSHRDICDLLPPWDPFWASACTRGQVTSSQVQGAAAYRSCAWLLRQVEQEESALAQVDKQRGAACGQDPAGAECQDLAAQYQRSMQRVRQDQATYNRCQAGHP